MASFFLAVSQKAAASHLHRLFDRVYAMHPVLEFGRRQAFFARYLWAGAVSRLLLRLAHGELPGRPGFHAWRAFDFGPDLQQTDVEEAIVRCLGQVYEKLTEGTETQEHAGFSAAPNPLRHVPLPPWDIPKDIHTDWPEFQAEARLDQIAPLEAWHARFAQAGEKLRPQLGEDLTEGDPPARAAARKAWSQVHRHPAGLARALRDEGMLAADGNGLEAEVAAERWAGIGAALRARRNQVAETRECARELSAAQEHYLPWGWRLGVAGAVALLGVYASAKMLYGILGEWNVPLILAACAAAGALAGALLPWWLEHRRGRKGKEEIEGMLGRIPGLSEDINVAAQNVLQAARGFLGRLQTRAAVTRLRALLLRAKGELDRRLQPQTAQVRVEDTPPGAAASEAALAAGQRRAFRDLVWRRQPLDESRLKDLTRGVIDDQVEGLAERFLARWRRVCEVDEAQAGHLPVEQLAPMLEAFRAELRRQVLSRLAQETSDRGGLEAFAAWRAGEVRALGREAYYPGLSVPATSAEIDRAAFQRSLFSRSVLREREAQAQNEYQGEFGISIAVAPELDRTAVLSVLVEEVPVAWAEGDNGFVCLRRRARGVAQEGGGA